MQDVRSSLDAARAALPPSVAAELPAGWRKLSSSEKVAALSEAWESAANDSWSAAIRRAAVLLGLPSPLPSSPESLVEAIRPMFAEGAPDDA